MAPFRMFFHPAPPRGIARAWSILEETGNTAKHGIKLLALQCLTPVSIRARTSQHFSRKNRVYLALPFT